MELDDVAERLRGRGLAVEVPALPSVGTDAPALGDLHDDARAIAAAIDRCDGHVVVCAHSYGGAPMTEAAAGRDDVSHLVYLAAFMPDVGESVYGQLELVDEVLAAPGAGVLVGDDGTHVVDPDLAERSRDDGCDDDHPPLSRFCQSLPCWR